MTELTVASLSSSFNAFFHAVKTFAEKLAAVDFGWLAIGLMAFTAYLTCRSIASYNVLRTAYPRGHLEFKRVWGGYQAGNGFNNVFPAHGGGIIRLFLIKTSIRDSSYPAVASAFFVESLFDWAMAIPVLTFAFSQGVFPKPPDFSKLPAFDLAFFASHPQLTVFIITALGVLLLIGFAYLADHVRAFWARIRQGLTILRDRRAYFRKVFLVQFIGWVCRLLAFWWFLDAFHVGGSLRNAMLVVGVSAVASVVPLTPGGAGVQQALLLKVFSGTASSATVAAYSVGQQIAIAVLGFVLGLASIVFIFGFSSFKEVIRTGRAAKKADEERERAAREKS